jgi:hypothetical protein
MAELNLEEIAEAATKLKSLEEAFKFLKEQVSKVTNLDSLNGIGTIAEAIGKKFNASTASVEGFKKELVDVANLPLKFRAFLDSNESMRKFADGFRTTFSELEKKIEDTGNSTAGFAAKTALVGAATTGLLKVPGHFAEIGKEAASTRVQLSGLVEDNKGFVEAVLGRDGAEKLANISKFADATANLERGLMMTAATTGTLSEMYKAIGEDLSGLSVITNDYNDVVTRTASATGMSSTQVATYLNTIMGMPGMMKSMSEQVDIAGRQMHILEGAITFAAGSGQKLEDVMDDMKFAASTLGLTGEDSLQFLDRMSSLSQATQLPLDKVRAAVKDLGSEFAMLTNNTDGTIDIFGELAPALAKANVAPDQMIAIAKNVTEGLNNMTTAQRAFLSSSTGGPGGLQGAFQIEQMLADGKQKEVFAKVKDNLTSRLGGGPIVTREQAGQSPEMAAQYQKQLMYMTSPAMGGMAKDDKMAARLIDAMAKGDIGEMAEGLSGSDEGSKDAALNSTFERGNRLQEHGNTILNNILQQFEYAGGGASQVINDVVGSTIGGESAINTETMAEARLRSSEIANRGITQGPGDETFGDRVQSTVMDMKDDLVQGFVDMFKGPLATDALGSSEAPRREETLPERRVMVQRTELPQRPQIAAASRPFNPTQAVSQELAGRDKKSADQAINDAARPTNVDVQVSLKAHCESCSREIASTITDQKITHHESAKRRQGAIGTR